MNYKKKIICIEVWLVVMSIGLCCCSSYGAELVGHYVFEGTSGGNVTDTVSGRNLTSYKWSSTDPADYFQLWSGSVVAKINLSAFTGGWATLFDINGNTTGDWDKVDYGIVIAPGNISAPTSPYTPNAWLGVKGNSQWKYLNAPDPSPATVPTGQLSLVVVSWDFNDVTNRITMSMWIDGTLRGTADVTPGYYPGVGGANNYRLNSIDLSQFTQGQFSEVWIYDGFYDGYIEPPIAELVGHYDFAGTTGGNVTDTVSGRNLTAGVWSSANPADYFQLWSGSVVAKINLNEWMSTWDWAYLFRINGDTTGDWDRVDYATVVSPGGIASPTLPYTPNAWLGVKGNGQWKYLNTPEPTHVTIPTGRLSTVTVSWYFYDVTNRITMSMWVNGTLRGTADVTPDYYPGIGGANNYRLNSISLNSPYITFSEVWIYDGFYDGYVEPSILEVSPHNRTGCPSAAQVTFDVNNIGAFEMNWTAEVIEGNGWLSILSGYSGTNFGTITVDAAENIGEGRTGKIRISAPEAIYSPTDISVTQMHMYPVGDLNHDCYVDLEDVKLFALYWLDSSCTVGTQCADADVETDTVIDFADFAVIAEDWMDCTYIGSPCNYNYNPYEFSLQECGTILFPLYTTESSTPEEPTILVGENRIVFYALPNESIEFSIGVSGRWTREGDETSFTLTDEAGTILQTDRVVEGESKVFSYPVPREGLYYLQVVPGYTACSFRSLSPKASFEASSETLPMSVYPRNGWLYFYVPKGTEEFKLHISSQVPASTWVVLGDIDGGTIFSTGSLTSEVLEIAVPPEMEGRIWSFKAGGPTGWQSMSFWFEGACPYLSSAPQGLVIPLVDYRLASLVNQTEVTLNFNLTDKDMPGVTQVNVRVEDETSATQYQETCVNLPDKVTFTVPDSKVPVAYRVTVDFEENNTRKTIAYSETIWIAHHTLLRKIRHENVAPLPQINEDDEARGFLTFSRPEPGTIYQDSVPKSEELTSGVELWATPGDYTAFHFAVHALTDLQDVTYQVTTLENEAPGSTGVIYQNDYDLRVVRYWPQLVVSYTSRFHIIPELLDRLHPIPIAQGQNGLFYGKVKIPGDADPGAYRGAIEVLVGGQNVATLELVINVLPFQLRTPDNIRWNLDVEADVTRDELGQGVIPSPANPSDEEPSDEIQARYQVIRDAGINSLVVSTIEFEYINGVIVPKQPALSFFNERMGVIKGLGFREPVVFRTLYDFLVRASVPDSVTDDGKTYTAPAASLYQQHLAIMAQEAYEHGWLDYIYYEVDEPGNSPAETARFIRTSKIIKGMGYNVFSTIGHYYIDQILNWIDYRCYNGIGYTDLLSQQDAVTLKNHTAAYGDVFWFYGGGSYGYLDGIICGNRYLNGLFLWRTGTTGIMNWIACWAMYSGQVDDFDLSGGWPSKDYCIYYPSYYPEDPLAPTLQWEGIREGIDDYRYLYTLMDMAQELMLSGDPGIAATAASIKTNMENRLNNLLWRHDRNGGTYPPQDITNGDLRQVRQEIINSILVLLNL